MWSRGWKSFVAIRRVKGYVRSVLMVGAMSRPPATAKLPVGGQKSSWKSTMIRAAAKSLEVAMLDRILLSPFATGSRQVSREGRRGGGKERKREPKNQRKREGASRMSRCGEVRGAVVSSPNPRATLACKNGWISVGC